MDIHSSTYDNLYYVYADGLVPYDGVPIEETTTVALPVTVSYILLATAGIVFTVVCLTFNFMFRNQQYVLHETQGGLD